VTVSVDAGDLRVSAADGDRVQLHGTAQYSLFRSMVTSHQTSSGIVLTSTCHLSTTQCAFDYHLGLPAGGTASLSDGFRRHHRHRLVSTDLTATDRSGTSR